MSPEDRLEEWMWLVEGGVDATSAAIRVSTRLTTLRRTATRTGNENALLRLDRAEAKAKEEATQRQVATMRGEAPMVTRAGGSRLRAVVAPCGTVAGAERHRKAGEPLCGSCRDAKRAYERDRYWRGQSGESERRGARGPAPQPQEEVCGTAKGARTHRRRGTDVCDACREAERVAGRERYRAHHTIERQQQHDRTLHHPHPPRAQLSPRRRPRRRLARTGSVRRRT